MPRDGSKAGRSGKSSKTARVMNLLTESDPIAENDAASSSSAGRKSSTSAAGAKRTVNDENTQEQIRNALEMELTDPPAPASKAKPASETAPAAKEPAAEPEEVFFEEEQEEPAAAFEPAQDPLASADEADTEEYDFDDFEEYDFGAAEEDDYEDAEDEISEDVEVEAGGDVEEEISEDVEEEVGGDVEEEISEDVEEEVGGDIEEEISEDAEEEVGEDVEEEISEDVEVEAGEDTEEDDDVEDFICFNVTQALVEDKTEKYMRMFGMCTCNRCRIDVIALALSNLPAKYVVAKPKDMVPRLSMYEAKYSAAVITQVMKACKKVIDLPHHKR